MVGFVGLVVAQLLQVSGASGLLAGGAPALPALLAGLGTFVLPVLTRSGASVGQRLVWLRPSWPPRPASARRLLLAAAGTAWSLSFALGAVVDPEGPLQLLALVLSLPGLVAPLSVPFTRGARGISLALAGADLVDSRAPVGAATTG